MQVALEDDERYEAEVEAITNHLFTVFDADEDGEIGPTRAWTFLVGSG